MRISIEVFLFIEGSHTKSGGMFNVNINEFKNNPDFTAAVAAFQYIEDIKKQVGYRNVTIKKVIYSGDKDITELTKQLTPTIPADNLPFWHHKGVFFCRIDIYFENRTL